MTMDSNAIPIITPNQVKSPNDSPNDTPEIHSSSHNINELEKLLSTYKLKHVKNCAVGYSKIANQIYKRSINTGFQLNLMVIGCSGLGKSSFLDSLFRTEFPQVNFSFDKRL